MAIPAIAAVAVPCPRHRRHHNHLSVALAASNLSCSILHFLLITALLVTLPSQTHGFAAWFVDRRVSCFTPLAADEIIMNAGVLPHSQSREPNIRIEVSPLDNGSKSGDASALPDSEYVVKFIVPRDENGNLAYHLSDIQYVFEIIGENPVAKFTSAPPTGGIGCEGKRSYGAIKGKDEHDGSVTAAAIFTINHDATIGAGLEIVAGWATGHTAVTLTDKIILFVGQGVAAREGTGEEVDDALQDDQAEVELEEAYIEEEREEFEHVIEDAEEETVAALEEKRRELGEDADNDAEITEAEEKVVEVMEANRHHVNEALDSLKDAIASDFADRLQNGNRKHDRKHNQYHEEKHRREAQREHRERHELKFKNKEGRLEEMRRHFANQNLNMDDVPKDRLNVLMNMKDSMKESLKKLHLMDGSEHDRARREHIQPLPKEELKLDIDKLKQKAQEKMNLLSDKLVGVHEMMNESPRMQEIRNKLKQGQMRGGEGVYHGDSGTPLPPKGRHFLIVMFSLLGLVGFVRWYLEKRRRNRVNKGRRNL